MSLPKIILDIVKIIHEKLEITPTEDKIITISLWDFKDENEDTIPKLDLKNGLRKLAEDEKLFRLKDIRCLDKLGRFSGEKIELEINRERIEKFYEKQYLPLIKAEVAKTKTIFGDGKQEQELPLARVEITSIPEIKIKGFEEKVILQKPKNKKIRLRQFPINTKWEDITIQFLNGQEVIVRVKNLTFQTTYEEMGFQDEKTKLPNKQWQFLKNLSETGGEISWKNPHATPKGKKQKQLLSDSLKAYFQIDESPFYSYKQEKSYKIRVHLIPEVKSEDKQQDDLEMRKEYKEQTPSVYDKYE